MKYFSCWFIVKIMSRFLVRERVFNKNICNLSTSFDIEMKITIDSFYRSH